MGWGSSGGEGGKVGDKNGRQRKTIIARVESFVRTRGTGYSITLADYDSSGIGVVVVIGVAIAVDIGHRHFTFSRTRS